MSGIWCAVCGTQHEMGAECPDELLATGDERHGWRINVDTTIGIEAYGVLLARAGDCWRARIMTYPNILWQVPGGGSSIKFIAATPAEAEGLAAEFIRRHCREQGWRMRMNVTGLQPAGVDPQRAYGTSAGDPAPRIIRFLPARFGVVHPIEPGGTGNLSETGLFIITSFPLDSGGDLKILLSIDDEFVPLAGEVRWMCRDAHAGRSPGMGVRLSAPPNRYVDYVRNIA